MRFQPKTEEEILAFNLLPDGSYKFMVMGAHNKVSKTGNDMIELKLSISYENAHHIIFDYLLEAMLFKLRHFAEATGLLDKYEAGEVMRE